LWGFLYGWTLFLVIQTGTIAAVGVGFGKFLGVFIPGVSTKNWIWHVGSGTIGLNTANLVAILIITLLTFTNTLGVKLGAAVQNVFTSAKIVALAAVVLVGALAKNAVAMAANFGAGWHAFWAGSGLTALHPVQVGASGPTVLVGVLTVVTT
jgi:APA family basic amino acid/polyamine antiporter